MNGTDLRASRGRSRRTMRAGWSRLELWAGCLLSIVTAPVLGAEPIRFNEHIRPLLSDRCIQCHGPDEKRREGGLRLDVRSGALGETGGPQAIVPGDPQASELLRRILSNDPEEVMPPPSAKKLPFTAAERKLLEQWIAEGAEYEGHWAFLPLRSEPPPVIDPASLARLETPGAAVLRNPIDAFVVSRLLRAGLTPSAEADRATLIRRVSLDLIGLPPSPEDVAAFVADPDPAAYERLVDRLLSSPHFGERWGRHWLDQARYADSNGYSIDAERPMWPYRDWVIAALNADQPFDAFTIEQLAGDLLSEPTKSQRIATGFHRNTLINQEGGSDREQFRVEATMDRVNTTGAVWLGLTVGCAQCHTHKYDPITQREYYQLLAFFNQAADANDRGPAVEVRRGEMFGTPVSTEKQPVPLAGKELAERRSRWEAETRERLKKHGQTAAAMMSAEWKPVEYGRIATEANGTLDLLADGSLRLKQPGGPRDTYLLGWTAAVPQVAAIRLRALTDETLPRRGPGTASNGNFVLTDFAVLSMGEELGVQRAWADHEQPGFPIAGAIDHDAKTGWAINVGPGQPAQLNADHEAVFILSEPLKLSGQPVEFRLAHELNANYFLGRFAIDVSATIPEAPAGDEDRLLDALTIPAAQRSDAQKLLLQQAFERSEPRARPQKANPNVVTAMVMQDVPEPRETFLFTRGDFTRPDRAVGPVLPGVLAAIAPQWPADEASNSGPSRRNRLDLARWLVDPQNPLTPRVTVNRLWMRYFGRGLVETEEDFGTQGAPPTHPDLLDWLSREFQQSGWQTKRLHRLIVTSATYRQASRQRPELAANDPRNALLGRQNRLRFDAEITRDAALSASGLLEPVLGGPSVHPPQPDGVYAFTQNAKPWPTATGPDRYRRTMYTFFYRSAPYPLLATFDAPDFQSVCTRRGRSNTPLQALNLANDVVFVELAQGLARRVLTEIVEPSIAARITRACRLCWSRDPSPTERAVLERWLTREIERLTADPAAAAAIAGDARLTTVDVVTQAAFAGLARTLLNTDAFITRD